MTLSIYFRIWGLMLMTRNLSLSPPKNFDDNYPNRTSENGTFECLFQAVTKVMSKNSVVFTVIGMIIAALHGVKHGALHYCTLESEKTAALRHNGDDYNGCMTLSPLATMEIHWWHTNVSTSHHFICAPPPDTTIYSDASLDGWGATNSLTTVGALWEDMDDLPHINVLELYIAKLVLTHLAANCQGSHIHLKLDNFAAVSYINKMGGTHSRTCNNVTQDIWTWRFLTIFGFLLHIFRVTLMSWLTSTRRVLQKTRFFPTRD